MGEPAPGLFHRVDDVFLPLPAAQAPRLGSVHGGAVGALVARRAAEVPWADRRFTTARVALSFWQKVPMEPLLVDCAVRRTGRSFQVVEVSVGLRRCSGKQPVARAEIIRVRGGQPPVERQWLGHLPPPAQGVRLYPPTEASGGFNRDALVVRQVDELGAAGETTMWCQLTVPVVDNDPEPDEADDVTPRVLATADMAGGAGAMADLPQHPGVNLDTVVHLGRRPRCGWLGLRALTQLSDDGFGAAYATLFDEHGPLGHVTQTILPGGPRG